jgi:hypothetical protein
MIKNVQLCTCISIMIKFVPVLPGLTNFLNLCQVWWYMACQIWTKPNMNNSLIWSIKIQYSMLWPRMINCSINCINCRENKVWSRLFQYYQFEPTLVKYISWPGMAYCNKYEQIWLNMAYKDPVYSVKSIQVWPIMAKYAAILSESTLERYDRFIHLWLTMTSEDKSGLK